MSSLVIVESPTKAKTISKFLGKKFVVKSSFGHVRDLPKTKLGVDVDDGFAMHYVVAADKKKIVKELQDSAKKSDEIYFATDEDREGEAITWHLAALLKIPLEKAKRLTFHEITAEAIKEALEHPRQIDLNLVNAQQARRALDRLVGYKLSPLLWKKIAYGLSAGRVQSVTVRLIVEREREIQDFKTQEYWTITGLFAKAKDSAITINAKLQKIDNKGLDKFAIKTKEEAEKINQEILAQKYRVSDLEKKTVIKQPPPPLITSTLQQEAHRNFGFSAKQTMMLAQQLYEGVDLADESSVPLITYMRTDSLNLSEKFLNEARGTIKKIWGDNYLPGHPRRFKVKSKLAQEAHEAVRPIDPTRTPESIKGKLEMSNWKLYDLIWRRAVGSQMAEAVLENTTITVTGGRLTFGASGSVIKFDGFLKIGQPAQKENLLPELTKNEPLNLLESKPEQHFTEPPARYNDASLVKTLEEYGIGRPSTYAPTIATIITRNYVIRDEKKRFEPTEMGFLVTDLLIKHFPQIVDYKFTAKMENDLDKVASGKKDWTPILKEFYEPFAKIIEQKSAELSKKELTEVATAEVCEKCGKPMVIKTGRYGRFLACTGFPECKNTKPLPESQAGEEKQTIDLSGQKCDTCGSPLIIKHGRYGVFLSCSRYPECKFVKKIQKGTGVACPQCGTGEIVEKRSKRGRTFYACGNYPKCKFALWNKPTGEKCVHCGSLMVYGPKNTTVCSHKECPGK